MVFSAFFWSLRHTAYVRLRALINHVWTWRGNQPEVPNTPTKGWTSSRPRMPASRYFRTGARSAAPAYAQTTGRTEIIDSPGGRRLFQIEGPTGRSHR